MSDLSAYFVDIRINCRATIGVNWTYSRDTIKPRSDWLATIRWRLRKPLSGRLREIPTIAGNRQN